MYTFKGLVLAITVGLLPPTIGYILQSEEKNAERHAMASLGYRVAAMTDSYPIDKYAMPEPFSSEPLVIYTWRGLENRSRTSREFADSE